MAAKSVRRFTIADGMILVAASAVGALILRSYLPGHARQLGYFRSIIPDRWGLWRAYSWLTGPPSCVVVPWMAALIVIRVSSPRPDRLRLAGQPGFVACVAVMVSVLPGLAWYATIRHRPGFQRPDFSDQAWGITLHWTYSAVLGSWIALALTRRWRPESSWVDRLGRVLGGYWVFSLLVFYGIQWAERLYELFS